MNSLPLLSRKLLRLSLLTLLMLIYKFNLPNCIMTNRLQIIMVPEGPKSKLASTCWRLTIKLRRIFLMLFELIIPNLGLKKMKQGIFVLSSIPNILQDFVHHYENLFSLQGNLVSWGEALRNCISITPNCLVVEQHSFYEQLLTI